MLVTPPGKSTDKGQDYEQGRAYAAEDSIFNRMVHQFQRELRRGKTALMRALSGSLSGFAIITLTRSTMRFMRVMSREMKAATAPRRNAGAMASEMTRET
jgi:hypothetical protein